MFNLSLNRHELQDYVAKQLVHFFPDCKLNSQDKLFEQSMLQALERTEYCFQHVSLTSYHYNGITHFSHLHADQYTLFLWFLSNSVWKTFQDKDVASRLFYLNKALNGVVCMYDTEMPNIFLIIHGGDIVLGKAKYDNFFVAYQGCTVGAIEGIYPVMGKGVAMAPHSMMIGQCTIGNRVTLGNQALLRNRNIASNSLYYRDTDTGKHEMKSQTECWAQSFFNVEV